MAKDQVMKMWEVYERQAEICSALSHPIRLVILDLLQEGEKTCSDLIEVLEIPKANLTQHLSVLRRADLVSERKEGVYKYFNLTMPEIKKTCSLLRQILVEQVEQKKKQGFELSRSLKRSLG